MYKIAVIGLGYVGFAQALALDTAYRYDLLSQQIIGADIDDKKVRAFINREMYIHEPGFEDLMREHEILVTNDIKFAIRESDVIFVCVGTPSNPEGSANLNYVFNVMRTIGTTLKNQQTFKTIILKSTVPPGTSATCIEIIEDISGLECDENFSFVFSPEFLREGSAISDIAMPDKIVIGADTSMEIEIFKDITRRMIRGMEIEHGFNDMFSSYTLEKLFLETSRENAELIKYANNSFLAMKISFINMMSWLCEQIPDGDVKIIAKALGMDSRISPKFLEAGVGYGGSCFPKDVKALISYYKSEHLNPELLESVDAINEMQKDWAFWAVHDAELGRDIKKIAIMGVAFKPETDDIRESPSLRTIELLHGAGYDIIVHDPKAIENFKREYPHIKCTESIKDALMGADAAIFLTSWTQYKNIKMENIKEWMDEEPIIIDGRRMFDPFWVKSNGIDYYGVGYSNV